MPGHPVLPDVELPDRAVPPAAAAAPEFGILGPDGKALLAARQLATGGAEALPEQRMPGPNPLELAAVCALALAAGLLARTAAQRPRRR